MHPDFGLVPDMNSIFSYKKKSYLQAHKCSVWPPCGTVLIGGMHTDLGLVPDMNGVFCLKGHDQMSQSFASFEHLIQNPPVFHSVALL